MLKKLFDEISGNRTVIGDTDVVPTNWINAMRFRSKLLQPKEASEPTLTRIHDVYMTPEERVEGEDQPITNALEGARSILRQPEKTENGLR
jgi:hypothetical protein